jgi:hypothetical protein
MRAVQVTLIFLIFALPALLAATSIRVSLGAVVNEKRALAEVPPVPRTLDALREYPHAFELWFNDHYALRQDAIHWYNLFRVRVTGESPNTNVVIGDDGWLFLGNHDWTLDEMAGALPFSPEALDAKLRVFADRKLWAEEHGITYLYLAAPNKTTIYREHVPPRLLRRGAVTRLSQLTPRMLAEHPDVFIDAVSLLEAAKPWSRLYHKTDSHWNEAGAFVIYEELMRRLHARGLLPSGPFPRERIRPKAERGGGGDLAVYLGLQNDLPEDHIAVRFDPKAAGLPVPETLRLLLIHDSFGPSLYEPIARHLPQAKLLTLYVVDPAKILRERPDVLLQERAERTLVHDEPDPPEIAEVAAGSRRFRAAPEVPQPGAAVESDTAFTLDVPQPSLLRIELTADGEGTLQTTLADGTQLSQRLFQGRQVFFREAPQAGAVRFQLAGARLGAPTIQVRARGL